jgi:hypothetical protein
MLIMKKLYTLLLVVICFSNASSQVINFADPNFKAKLLEADVTNEIALDLQYNRIKIDVNNNGEIEQSESDLVRHLNVSNSNISTINGIEYFDYIESLNVSNNQLTSLNLDMPTLIIFNCRNNQLTSLVVNLPLLDTIDCSSNQLTSLDLSSSIYILSEVYVQNNQLSSLIFPSNVGLSNLNIRSNNFDGFDLTVAPPYMSFVYGDNPNDTVIFPDYYYTTGGISYSSSTATNLDLTHLKAFGDSFSSANFYIGSCPNLQSINFKNQIIYVQGMTNDVGEYFPNFWRYQFFIQNCPNFNSICCDEAEIVYFSSPSAVHTTNSVIVNSECAFLSTPSFETDQLTLSPNPATSILSISIPNNKVADIVSVYNPIGQLVLQSNTSNSIDVSTLNTGTYFIKIHSDGKIFTEKFIKE